MGKLTSCDDPTRATRVETHVDRGQFKRGWVVQEIGTNTPATMLWGDSAIEWQILADVCEKLKVHYELRSTLGITTSDICFLFRRFIEPDGSTHHANRFNFVYELQRARHLNFSDDRDRVFAFLGHFSTRSLHPLGCGTLDIAADYTKNVEQTYIDVAVQMLKTNPATVCILLASVQHPRPTQSSSRDGMLQTVASFEDNSLAQLLPSWVPEWRWFRSILLAEPICPHRAAGNSSAKLEVKGPNNGILRTHGIEIDWISVTSQPLGSNDFYCSKPSKKQTTIERLWREICNKQRAFELNDTYPNGDSSFFACMQSLSNGCVQAAGHRCEQYDQTPKDSWLRKAVQYVVSTVGPTTDVSALRSVVESAPWAQEDEDWDRWAASASEGRTFARTDKGYYVLGPGTLQAGDVVCVLFGCKVPFCLRPVGKYHLLVGECYVHGFMESEAMDALSRTELSEKVFDII